MKNTRMSKTIQRGQYVNEKRQLVFDGKLYGCNCLHFNIMQNVRCDDCPIHSCYYEHARMTGHIVEEEMLCPVPMDFEHLIEDEREDRDDVHNFGVAEDDR